MATHPTTPGRLEQLRLRYPNWTIERAPEPHTIGYVATCGEQRIWAAHLGALEVKLANAEGGTL